jgi:hypothetical protein
MDLQPSRTKAQRLKRVFNINIETCRECSGMVNVIAYFENPMITEKISAHLQQKLTSAPAGLRPASRARSTDLFGLDDQTVHVIPIAVTLGPGPGKAAQAVGMKVNGGIGNAESVQISG